MTTSSELASISAALHDQWFEIDQLTVDLPQGVVRLPIYAGRMKKRWLGWSSRPPGDPLPPPLGSLVVRNVIDVVIEDEADIGWYDLNRVEWSAEAGTVRIVSGFPCEIVVRCQGLDVQLQRD